MEHDGHLNLGELVDLEKALSAGRAADVLRAETIEALVPSGTPTRRQRIALLRTWLDAAYRSHARPGTRLERGTKLLSLGLVIAGLLAGAGAARYALAYEGVHPVNVVGYLSLLVLPQIALALMLLLNVSVKSITLKHVTDQALGVLHAALLKAVRAKTIQADGDSAVSIDLGALYRPAMSWHIFFSMQVFGVAFNVAALAMSLALVTFTDLAFSWSTTLRVDSQEAHQFVSVLAAPFSWVEPHLVPSLEVVKKTRYFRLEGRYAGAAQDPKALRRAIDLSATTAWWPFLAACLVVYGLLPRLILTFFAWARLKYLLRQTPLEAYEIDRLVRACLARAGGFHLKAGSDTDPGRRNDVEQTALVAPSSEGVAIVWRDAPFSDDMVRAHMRRVFDVEIRLILRAGGTAGDLGADETASRIAVCGADSGAIYVLVDAFEAVGKALVRFLAGLRGKVGARRLILLLPVEEGGGVLAEPPVDRRKNWQRAARQLADPFLGVPDTPEEARHDA